MKIRVQPHPRLVDWALFVLVTGEMLSGFGSFLVGRPSGRWVFVLHGVMGLALVLLLVWKVRRIWPRVAHLRRWDRKTVFSVLALLAVAFVLGTGVIWTSWQWPAHFPNGMYLHVCAGLVLTALLWLHTILRFKLPQTAELRSRRTALGWLAALTTGGAFWWGQQQSNRWFALPGEQRRFTGSRAELGNFPVTMWMFDNPPPLTLSTWQLRVHGAVAQEFVLSYADLPAWAMAEQVATLDCTSGWYTTQRWQGVPVAELLAVVKPTAAVVAVSFRSITGYRWSLPLAEAKEVLLATHVNGELLAHGHGAPLRLVAPGRRGFQWVKWVTEVELLTEPDYGQWRAIFTSGL